MSDKSLVYLQRRLDGKTYEEIGNEFEVSAPTVRAAIERLAMGQVGRNGRRKRKCVYPFIETYMQDESIGVVELWQKKGMGLAYDCFRKRLYGKIKFSVDEALKFCEYFNKPVEIVFCREENKGEDNNA